MADTPRVYVICDANCKWEGMTKEQILTAIAQAVETGSIGDVDTGFVTTIKTINGHGLKFFAGEQHEYDALTDEQKQGLFAIITNDTTREGLLDAIETLNNGLSSVTDNVNQIISGVKVVGRATTADNAKTAMRADAAESDINGNPISVTYATRENLNKYRKKADARQFLNEEDLFRDDFFHETYGDLYPPNVIWNKIGNEYPEMAEAFKFDLSELLNDGYTGADTIGVSGCLEFEDIAYKTCTLVFSTLWDIGTSGVISGLLNDEENTYIVARIGIDENNKFCFMEHTTKSFKDSGAVQINIREIRILYLNIFYK